MRAAFIALAVVSLAVVPAADAAAKVVFFSRELGYAGLATPGFDFGILYDEVSYEDVEVRVVDVRNCDSLLGAMQVTTVPPVPFPNNGVFLLTFGCGGLQSYDVIVRPNATPDQGHDYPFSLEWTGTGRGNVTIELAGVPWDL